MGYDCVLAQVTERFLMDLSEESVVAFFEQARSEARGWPSNRPWFHEPLTTADRQLPWPISLQKMSAALHHLLTGEFRPVASPLSRAIVGGTAFRIELCYGPARYLWAEEVREVAVALAAVTPADLRNRYDPVGLKAAGLETPVHRDEDEKELFDELDGYFQLLARYYRLAATCGNAMMIAVV